MGKEVKNKSINKKKLETKKGEPKIVSNNDENDTKRIVTLVIAIIIFIILLLLLVSCQEKNNTDKLKGNVKQETADIDKINDEDIKSEEESDFSSNKLVYISTVTNGGKTKQDLVDKKVDIEKIKEEVARKAVQKARETLTSKDIILAENLVNDLQDDKVKDELLEELEEIKEIHNIIELVEKLEEMTNNAENKDDVIDAKDFRDEEKIIKKVENLKDEKIKENLKERLEALKPILDDTTDPIITGVLDGKTYNEKVNPGVIEENIRSITLNGKPYVIGEEIPDGIYTFKVVDMAYNYASVSFIIDTTKADITLNGNENIILEYMSDSYVEEGATYVDNIDGSGVISVPSIIMKDGNEVSSVDVNVVGVYELKYKYTDSAGNEAVKIRIVEVKDTVLPTAKATQYYKNGKYVVKLTEISEDIKEENILEFIDIQSTVTITDLNENENIIIVENESIVPIITETLVSSDDYTMNYSFSITDDSDIEVVKVAKGELTKEAFEDISNILTTPYNYSITENGKYTVYAKDKMGNESVKLLTIDNITTAVITDEELENAFIISESVYSYENSMITYTKTVKVNPDNKFMIKEIKLVSTTLKYSDITANSFKNSKIHGSSVKNISSNEFKIVDQIGAPNDNYYYIYFVAEKGAGANKAVRECVKTIVVSP